MDEKTDNSNQVEPVPLPQSAPNVRPDITPVGPPVMDVKPPAPSVVAAPVVDPENDTISPEVPATPAPPEVSAAPTAPTDQPVHQNDEPSTVQAPATEPQAPTKKQSSKLASILLIVLIAGVLIALALYFYVQNKP